MCHYCGGAGRFGGATNLSLIYLTMVLWPVDCNIPGGANRVVFRLDTNDIHEPLWISLDNSATFFPYDSTMNNNNPAAIATDLQWRVGLFLRTIELFALLPQNQHCWNHSQPLAQWLLVRLLGFMQPTISCVGCGHCHSANNLCEGYRLFPVYLLMMHWMLHSGSGNRGVGTWIFPNQAPVVRWLQYDRIVGRATYPGSQSQYARLHWPLFNHLNPWGQAVQLHQHPICVTDGIREICDYNIRLVAPQFGTMPRP